MNIDQNKVTAGLALGSSYVTSAAEEMVQLNEDLRTGSYC
jgi:hypothetical protein